MELDTMKHISSILSFATLLTLAFTLAIPAVSFAKHPTYRVRHVRKIVVHPPRPRRIVEVVRPERRKPDSEKLSIGLRASGTGLEGEKLGLESVENPAMGGIGIQLRSRVDKNWSLELSTDFLHSNDTGKGFTQTTVPVMLSALLYLFPNSAINPYALVGGGVHFTNLKYLDGQFEHHILELAGQVGFGVQVKLSDRVSLHSDLRFLSVYKNLGNVNKVSQSCLSSKAGGIMGYCDGLSAVDGKDKFNIGAQFQAGVSYNF
jgi:opacity protein-like surface antigen